MLEGLKNWATGAKQGAAMLFDGAKEYVRTYPERWKAKSLNEKIGTVLLGAGIAGCCVASMVFPPAGALVSGGALVAANVIGLGAYGMMLAANTVNKNGDVLKVMPFATGALAVQKYMLGGLGYAIIAGVAFARTSMLSNIPQEEQLKRRLVAGACWAAGTAALALPILANPLNLLPFASMTMASVGDTLPNNWSHYSRLGRFCAFMSNAAYSLLFTGSLLNTSMDLTVGATNANAIKKFDIPQNPEGQKVPFMDRLALYAEKVVSFKPMPKAYPEPTEAIRRVEPKTSPRERADNVVFWDRAIRDLDAPARSTRPSGTPHGMVPQIHMNFDRGADPYPPASAALQNTGTCKPLRRIGIHLEAA